MHITTVIIHPATVDAAGYLHMIHQMKELITAAGKKAYTLVMGKPNPAKLANFPEVNFDMCKLISACLSVMEVGI